MQDMARYGRNGDTRMAHVAPGEVVVPQEVLAQRPQVARGLGMAFRDVGADPSRYVVGSKRNSINPITGEPEFFLDKLIEFGTKALSNPMVQGAVTNVAYQALRGEKPSLRDALIGGAIGGGLGAVTGRGTGMDALDALLGASKKPAVQNVAKGVMNAGPQALQTPQVTSPVRAQGLLGIGELLGTNPQKGIGKLLNTKAGEALLLGLGSQLVDSLFSEEEDPDPYGMMERFNRGAGQAPVKLRRRPNRNEPMLMEDGGAAYFPRRNGGIMPNEGSGTKDDVPAMLTAGEFVMTRDAVKGAGGGNLNNGIQKMYGMMDKLEDMA